jgi:hypothetical protein
MTPISILFFSLLHMWRLNSFTAMSWVSRIFFISKNIFDLANLFERFSRDDTFSKSASELIFYWCFFGVLDLLSRAFIRNHWLIVLRELFSRIIKIVVIQHTRNPNLVILLSSKAREKNKFLSFPMQSKRKSRERKLNVLHYCALKPSLVHT